MDYQTFIQTAALIINVGIVALICYFIYKIFRCITRKENSCPKCEEKNELPKDNLS